MGFPDDDFIRSSSPHIPIRTQDGLREQGLIAEQQHISVKQDVTLGHLGGVGVRRCEAGRQKVNLLPHRNTRAAVGRAWHIGSTHLARLVQDNSVWVEGECLATVRKGALVGGVKKESTQAGNVQTPTTTREADQV